MTDFDQFITKREAIERIEMVFPINRRDTILDALFATGWRIVRSGLYTDKKMWPKCDPSRVQIVAEYSQDASP